METRNKYERFMSNWFFENLPDTSEGTMIMDIDFFLSDYRTKKFLFLELKTKGNDITKGQRIIYNMLHKRLIKTNNTDGRTYMGTHLLKFENENFHDGKVWLDGNTVDEYKFYNFITTKLGIE